MVLTGCNSRTWNISCPMDTVFATNFMLTDLGTKPGLIGEMFVGNSLGHDHPLKNEEN